MIVLGIFLNYFGGTIRFIFGTVFRKLSGRKQFTFYEYIYGPNNPSYFDEFGHQFNNKVIGTFFLFFIINAIILLIKNF